MVIVLHFNIIIKKLLEEIYKSWMNIFLLQISLYIYHYIIYLFTT